MITNEPSKLERIIADARRSAESRDQGYREQALKLTRGSAGNVRASSPVPTYAN